MHDFVGTVVADRYAIEAELGRGGMATVWRARDVRHDRPVAVKILHAELAGAIGVERFVREVRLTARLQHPGIAPVLDSGVLTAGDGTSLPWFAMPYLNGESLRAVLAREHQLPVERALFIADAVAAALDASHRQGILHRDIKPENVILADGAVYVVDFGIAKALIETGGERLTSTGLSIGTLAYMSPEQSAAGEVDARSDQYSLATLLYEMLTGEPPFTGSAQAIVGRRFTEPARPLRAVRPTVPEPVERAVLRALERVPADRFVDIAAFSSALRAAATPGPGLSAGRRSHVRGRAAVAAGLLAIAMLAAWIRLGAGRLRRRPVRAPEVVALYQRGVRAYDTRSASGAVDAIASFSAAVKRDSTYPEAWNGLAKTYVRAYERGFPLAGIPQDSVLRLALSAVRRALAEDSTSSDTWLTQALLSRNIDPTDDAPVLRSLRKSIALDSSDARSWHFLAISLVESGDFGSAMSAWRRSVQLDPSYTQGLTFLALGYYWRRQYDSAAKWADSALALDPNYILGLQTAGYIAIERGNHARGVAAFEAVRRLTNDAESLNALLGVALAEARAGHAAAARARLREAESEAAAYTPPPLHTVAFIAQVYAALGDAGRAADWLTRFQPRASMHFQLHLRCDPPFKAISRDRRFLLLVAAPPPAGGC